MTLWTVLVVVFVAEEQLLGVQP